VEAVAESDLRDEFLTIYAGEPESKRKAYKRALTKAPLGLIRSRRINGLDYIWLPTEEEGDDVDF
jgi:hypothetical protein